MTSKEMLQYTALKLKLLDGSKLTEKLWRSLFNEPSIEQRTSSAALIHLMHPALRAK